MGLRLEGNEWLRGGMANVHLRAGRRAGANAGTRLRNWSLRVAVAFSTILMVDLDRMLKGSVPQ
jgi:hypothetical protein